MSLDRDGLAGAPGRAWPRWCGWSWPRCRGSAPREVGAAMLVWDGGPVRHHRRRRAGIRGGAGGPGDAGRRREPGASSPRDRSGPTSGSAAAARWRCCSSVYRRRWRGWARRFCALQAGCAGSPAAAVQRLRARARAAGARPKPRLIDGWFIEPVAPPAHPGLDLGRRPRRPGPGRRRLPPCPTCRHLDRHRAGALSRPRPRRRHRRCPPRRSPPPSPAGARPTRITSCSPIPTRSTWRSATRCCATDSPAPG